MPSDSRLFTVKLSELPEPCITVNSIGFRSRHESEYGAANKIGGIDPLELRRQLEQRGGMVHIVVRGQKHWYV